MISEDQISRFRGAVEHIKERHEKAAQEALNKTPYQPASTEYNDRQYLLNLADTLLGERDSVAATETLRDHFAIAALQSPFAMHWTFGPTEYGGPSVDLCADRAYLIADAMLARRKQ